MSIPRKDHNRGGQRPEPPIVEFLAEELGDENTSDILDNKCWTPEEEATEGEGGDMRVKMEGFGADDSDEEEREEIFS